MQLVGGSTTISPIPQHNPHINPQINYLVQQLAWVVDVVLDGIDWTCNAFFRELMRILRARTENGVAGMPQADGGPD